MALLVSLPSVLRARVNRRGSGSSNAAAQLADADVPAAAISTTDSSYESSNPINEIKILFLLEQDSATWQKYTLTAYKERVKCTR